MRDVAAQLEQTETWNGQPLQDLDEHHVANLIPFLRGNARTLQRVAEERYYRSLLFLASDPSDGILAAQDAIESEFLLPAQDWLERRPLMRRLVELDRGRPLSRRRLTHLRNRLHERRTGYRKVRFG